MRSRIFPLILIFAMVFISACKKGLLDVTEEFYLETSIPVVGNAADFDIGQELDALSASDVINKYASNIKSLEVEEVSYYITDFNGSSTQRIEHCSLEVGDASGMNCSVMTEIEDVLLCEAFNETEVPCDGMAMDKFCDLIKNEPHRAMLFIRGSVNDTPLDFTLQVKFKVKMVAGAL